VSDEKKKDVCSGRPLTYEDYAKLDDGKRYELVDGVLELMSPAPTPQHQMISHEIVNKLSDSCKTNYVILHAPIDLILSDTVVRQPDLVLIHRDRFSKIVKKRGIVGVPDLVVEILSPSSVKRDRVSKLQTYARFKIPEYWIVDANNRCIEQYVLDEKRYAVSNVYVEDEKIQSDNIPCASISINDILANVLEVPED